jgi:hypothetical protein
VIPPGSPGRYTLHSHGTPPVDAYISSSAHATRILEYRDAFDGGRSINHGATGVLQHHKTLLVASLLALPPSCEQ